MAFRFPGPITMANASASLAACVAALDAGEADVTLDAIAHSDSSAVAVLIAATRHARSSGRNVRFHAMPAGVVTLVGLYGVNDLIDQAGVR